MVHSIGFEPTTFAFGGQCSNPTELRMHDCFVIYGRRGEETKLTKQYPLCGEIAALTKFTRNDALKRVSYAANAYHYSLGQQYPSLVSCDSTKSKIIFADLSSAYSSRKFAILSAMVPSVSSNRPSITF